MTKTLNQIIFFSPPKSEYFFQQHWESEWFFLEKNHNLPFKLNGRSLMSVQLTLQDIRAKDWHHLDLTPTWLRISFTNKEDCIMETVQILITILIVAPWITSFLDNPRNHLLENLMLALYEQNHTPSTLMCQWLKERNQFVFEWKNII